MLQKIWYAHCVAPLDGDNWLLYIDRHLVNEVTSPQAFAGLRTAGRHVRRPENTIAVADHNVPTEHRNLPIADEESRVQVSTLETNVARSEEHTSELQSLMRISYAVFCLKKKKKKTNI